MYYDYSGSGANKFTDWIKSNKDLITVHFNQKKLTNPGIKYLTVASMLYKSSLQPAPQRPSYPPPLPPSEAVPQRPSYPPPLSPLLQNLVKKMEIAINKGIPVEKFLDKINDANQSERMVFLPKKYATAILSIVNNSSKTIRNSILSIINKIFQLNDDDQKNMLNGINHYIDYALQQQNKRKRKMLEYDPQSVLIDSN
jgi:hypothetical protein